MTPVAGLPSLASKATRDLKNTEKGFSSLRMFKANKKEIIIKNTKTNNL